MRRAHRVQLALLVIVAVLATAVLWTQQRRAASAAPERLLPIGTDQVTRIDVKTGSGVLRRFEKSGGHWQMLAPQQGQADAAHLDRLTAIANAKVLRWRPASEFDLEKIGLDPPWAVVSLNGQRLEFGTLAALAPQRYVKIGDHIALIPSRYAADIAATPDSELAGASSTLPRL